MCNEGIFRSRRSNLLDLRKLGPVTDPGLWNLSTNLWGQIIEGVRYRRVALGHKYGGVWTVNPAMTSQKCSACGERGLRVKDSDSIEEERGGEFFYCPTCESRLHADVNAARNILKVQIKPNAVVGWTT